MHLRSQGTDEKISVSSLTNPTVGRFEENQR